MGPGEVLRVLLRSAAEIAYRLSCVKSYLAEVKAVRPEYAELVGTLEAAIGGIEGRIPETFSSVQRAISTPSGTDQGVEVLLRFLQTLSHWFVQTHELLVYLPRPSVAPEIAVTLSATFGSRYTQHRPSLILGSVFNAFEWDFLEQVVARIPDLKEIRLDTRENIVLELAVCDRASPYAWAILAHEMGHAIDEAEHISLRVAEKFVKDPNSKAFKVVASWCAEACADLIGARVMGPAPMLALLSLEYCIYPQIAIHQGSETHPATQWRLNVVSEYLQAVGGLDLLSKERALYGLANEYSLLRSETDPANIRDASRRSYEVVFKPLASEVLNEISKLNLATHALERQSLDRCDSRLRVGAPIAAQGAPRETLRKRIEEYRVKREPLTGEERKRLFRELVDAFAETPLNIPTILTSGSLRRLDMMDQIINKNTLPTPEEVVSLCDEFRELDELVLSSIRTSAIQTRIQSSEEETGKGNGKR